MADEIWMDRVVQGDFDAVPQPLTWQNSFAFSQLLDGYELAEAMGCLDLGDLAYRARQRAEKGREWVGTASELWCILFLEHRAARLARSAFDRDPLLDVLCSTLRFSLQIVPEDERAMLVRFMKAKRDRRERTGRERRSSAERTPAAA